MKRFFYGLYLVLAAAATILLAFDVGGSSTALTEMLNLPTATAAGGCMLAMAVAPFPTDPVLTAIARAYKNAKYIADMVMPRVPVAKQEFKYLVFDKRETMTIPNTFVGRKGQPNQVAFSATEVTDSCNGYGLDDPIPQDDIDNTRPGYDPQGQAVEGITELLHLDREKRVADIVFAAATYTATTNRTQLSGNHQWNVVHADSNPIPDIMNGLEGCVMRPNIMVIGSAAWLGLRSNAFIVKACNRNSGDTGLAERRAVADLFELEDILVGQAFVNSAKKGQTASLSRLWGKHCALLHTDGKANGKRVTFGWTAQWEGRIAGSLPDKNIGLRGGVVVRAGEYVKEVVTAPDLGYFIQDCVA